MPKNDLTEIPAACPRCGGWTGFGGMSQYRDSKVPVLGRTGCTCNKPATAEDALKALDALVKKLDEMGLGDDPRLLEVLKQADKIRK